jgi:predicted alpha/beta superfamily hydrolase
MDAPLHDTTSVIVSAPGASGDLRVDLLLPPRHPLIPPVPDDRPLPLMLVLDADLMFPIVAGLSRIAMIADVAPHVVAGVGYPDGDTFPRIMRRRVYDGTFDDAQTAPGPGLPPLPGGGGAAFLAALTRPVLAAIAAHRPVDRSRVCLYGSSLSGRFAGGVLLRDRGRTFTGVALQSALIAGEGERNVAKLAALTGADLPPGFRAFVSVGGTERPETIAAWTAVARAWTASGVTVESHVLDGETHMSLIGPSYTRALRWFVGPKTSPPVGG